MLLMSDFQKLVRCSRPELLLLAQTFVWLGIMRIAIAVFPFQKIARWLGLKLGELPPPIFERHVADIKKVQWAISVVSRRTLWDSACLAQSLTGAVLLQKKNIPALLNLGIAKDDSRIGYSAHAWLQCGETILTGAGVCSRYKVIASFRTCD